MECAYIHMLVAQKVKYVWINNLSKIRNAANNKVEISRLSFPTLHVPGRSGLEARVTPNTDLGRHLVMKTTEMLRFGGGKQQGGIQQLLLLLLTCLWLKRMVAMTTEEV